MYTIYGTAKAVDITSLDLQKMFDEVPLKLLVKKLKPSSIYGNILS